MVVERGYRNVIFESYSPQIVSAFQMTQVIGEILPMFVILLLKWLPLQNMSFVMLFLLI